MPINDKKNLTSQGCLGDKAWVMMGNDQFDSHKESNYNGYNSRN